MGLIIFFCNKPLVCSLSQSHIADGMRFQRHDILVLQFFGFVVSSTYASCFYYSKMCRLVLPSKLLYMKRTQCSNHCSHYCEKTYIQSTTSYIFSQQNSEWCQNDGFANKHTNCMWIQRGWVMVLMEY